MERLSFDTTFLIDLQREKIRTPGPAHEFLRQRPEAIPCLSLVAMAEFAEGFPSPRDPACLLMVDSFELLPFDRETAETYAHVSRVLRKCGERIGGNDLWIASTSLRHGLPLVTRNARELRRVPGLACLEY